MGCIFITWGGRSAVIMVSFGNGSGMKNQSCFFGFGGRVVGRNRFVCQLRPQLPDALEILHRAPVQALGLSLVADEQWTAVAVAGEAQEAIGEAVICDSGPG